MRHYLYKQNNNYSKENNGLTAKNINIINKD